MSATLRSTVRRALAVPALALATTLPCGPTLSLMRRLNHVQLTVEELGAIIEAIRRHPGCRLLIFGTGNDTPFWTGINKGGRTVFLEDDPAWLERLRARMPGLEVYPVHYDTVIEQWRELLPKADALRLELPPQIAERSWDVILVDAPAGFGPGTPGRMKSIAGARHLIGPGGQIFVHDCDREVERAWSDHCLTRQHLTLEVGKLRRYELSVTLGTR